jgi:hypothetical protein
LGGAKEANSLSTYVDSELNFPLGCCDADGAPTLPSPGVCRGHLDLFDSEAPQVIWQAGEVAYFQLSDHAYSENAAGSTHYGGSCQVGFSVDRGQTWKMAASFIGNCPYRQSGGSPEQQTFEFNVPLGIPEGDALFAWLWLNREHESFFNCAKVRIGSSVDEKIIPAQIEGTFRSERQPSERSRTMTGYDYYKSPSNHLLHSRRKRTDTCIWESAPQMETSYYTTDAMCMPNAKLIKSASDIFEVGWDVSCGVVEGDGEYPIEVIDCGTHV